MFRKNFIELPGAKDDRIKKLVSSKAELEFWELTKQKSFRIFLFSANNFIKKLLKNVGKKL
jgi:SecD/SecF fusion protein